MSFRAFLRDRWVYIAVYVASSLLTITLVQLDLSISKKSLEFANLVYVFILGIVGLVLFLGYDYRRQAAYVTRLKEVGASDSLDQMGLLPEASTEEHKSFNAAWQRVYGRLRTEIANEREAGRERVRMITQWAHHMKTPVAVINLELQKARKRESHRSDDDAILASVSEETERLDHLLQSLLNAIRLDGFAGDFRIESVELEALARQVINEQRRSFILRRVFPKITMDGRTGGTTDGTTDGRTDGTGDEAVDETSDRTTDAKRVAAASESEEGPPQALTVETDAKWLRFVLEQILGNSLKYASRPDRYGHVTFRIGRRGPGVDLEIIDDGIGIDPEDQARVFEPFFTGSNGRAEARSTGMGLYLAKEACRKLGHELTLTSSPGEGTCVRIRFETAPTIHSGLTRPLV